MPVWYFASLLLLVSETITHRHESHVGPLGVAVAFRDAAIALSLLSLVPINNRSVRSAWNGRFSNFSYKSGRKVMRFENVNSPKCGINRD